MDTPVFSDSFEGQSHKYLTMFPRPRPPMRTCQVAPCCCPSTAAHGGARGSSCEVIDRLPAPRRCIAMLRVCRRMTTMRNGNPWRKSTIRMVALSTLSTIQPKIVLHLVPTTMLTPDATMATTSVTWCRLAYGSGDHDLGPPRPMGTSLPPGHGSRLLPAPPEWSTGLPGSWLLTITRPFGAKQKPAALWGTAGILATPMDSTRPFSDRRHPSGHPPGS